MPRAFGGIPRNNNRAAARITEIAWDVCRDEEGHEIIGDLESRFTLQRGGENQFRTEEIHLLANRYRWEVRIDGKKVGGMLVQEVNMDRARRRLKRSFRSPLSYAQDCCVRWLTQHGYGEFQRASISN